MSAPIISESSWEDNYTENSSKTKYPCPFCHREYTNKQNRSRHKLKEHSERMKRQAEGDSSKEAKVIKTIDDKIPSLIRKCKLLIALNVEGKVLKNLLEDELDSLGLSKTTVNNELDSLRYHLGTLIDKEEALAVVFFHFTTA